MRFAKRPTWVRRVLLRPVARPRLPGGGRVALTFDDGPDPVHTPSVLTRLRAAGTTGTFFLVGERAAAAPDVVGRVVADGHAIGNHTFTHPRLKWWDFRAAGREVARCEALLSELAPSQSRWFRPPFGRLTPGLWAAARKQGLRVVTWSLDSGDWRCRSATDAAACAAEVLALVRPGDTVLVHDDHPWAGPILDIVLPVLADRGLGRVDRS